MSEECIHTDGIHLITYYLTCNVLDPFYVKNKQINGKYSLPRATAELLTLCIQFEVELRWCHRRIEMRGRGESEEEDTREC